jgi:hypothetical protein
MSSIEFDPELVDDETSITEISFLPDGRVCLFGASREVVALFCELNLSDESLRSRHGSAQAFQIFASQTDRTETSE